jgi:hypothetical protein
VVIPLYKNIKIQKHFSNINGAAFFFKGMRVIKLCNKYVKTQFYPYVCLFFFLVIEGFISRFCTIYSKILMSFCFIYTTQL